MPIYRCNSCGATTDTEATARALGYGPGTRFVVAAPTRCGVCGSNDISEISVQQFIPKPTETKTKEAKVWLWLGIACISGAILGLGLLYFGLTKVDDFVVYAFAASFFTLGCLLIAVRKRLANL